MSGGTIGVGVGNYRDFYGCSYVRGQSHRHLIVSQQFNRLTEIDPATLDLKPFRLQRFLDIDIGHRAEEFTLFSGFDRYHERNLRQLFCQGLGLF